MCVLLSPGDISKTLGLIYKAGDFHYLAYQNTVSNLAVGGQGNCMILPIPAIDTPQLLDTSSFSKFLDDMERSTREVQRSLSFSLSVEKNVVIVFDFDVYTVVLSNNATMIPAALQRVPADRRPALNNDLFETYGIWYRGFWFAMCCFNNEDSQRALPLYWKYRPVTPNLGFFPATDSHTGGVPDLKAKVDVDHTIFAASDRMFGGEDVTYSNWERIPPDARAALPNRVQRYDFQNTRLVNGDWIVDFIELETLGHTELRRVAPRYADLSG